MKVLRVLKQLIDPSARDPSSCERCGSDFVCGATLGGCWCSELKLDDTQRADLKQKYQRCLCRACLEQISADGSVDVSRAGV
jgi:Cysteine-rich CWC